MCNDIPLYKDSTQPIAIRVDDLISRMSVNEKAAQLCSDLPMNFVEDGKVKYDEVRAKYSDGLGRITQYNTLGLISANSIAKLSNQIQKYFVEETKHGIPVILQGENLCGYPGSGGTLFPSMINLGSAFRPDLTEKMAEVISEETKAIGIRQALSPVIDVTRDPRWGRTYETFGEDPYVVTQMGIRYVKGMQGNKVEGVVATAKHFLGYAETQGGVNMTATRLCDRELYEVFGTPFEAAIKEADLGSVMASYSDIDGLPVAANKKIATDLLRGTMGFEGALVSDGAAIMKIFEYHKIGKTYDEAGFLAFRSGCDTEMPIGNAYRHLPDYIEKGLLSVDRLDEAVRRILKTKFEYGLFENPYIDESKVNDSMSNDAKWDLVQEVTDESLILIKNDENFLPLKKGLRMAVIGPHAGSLREPISGYTYPAYVEMILAANDKENKKELSFNGMADEAAKIEKGKGEKRKTPFTTSVFDEKDRMLLKDMDQIYRGQYKQKTLAECLEGYGEVSYAQGCRVIDDSYEGFKDAVEIAEASDVVILTLGGNCGWFDTTGGEGKDRSSLDLPGVQQELLEAVVATGKPVVLVLYGPGIFATEWALKNVSSIIQAWLPGARGAESIGKALFGEINPSGKLPVSIPRSAGHIPAVYNHRSGSGFGSDKGNLIMGCGYVDSPDTPLLYFGHGLSYTDFLLESFNVSSEELVTDDSIDISIDISNVGNTTGKEVIQLYYRYKDAWVTRPVMQLTGFRKVELRPSEKRRVVFHLDSRLLGFYNEDMEFVVEPGALDIMIGTSSDNIQFRKEITMTGNKIDLMGRRQYTCESELI
jgi:beta-glucosidase